MYFRGKHHIEIYVVIMIGILEFFTISTFFQMSYVNSKNCSTAKCDCFYGKRGFEADCSNLGLLEVPTFSENVELIILKGNLIKQVHILENLPKVRYFDISHCRVKYIDSGAFQNLGSLEYLDISFNEELGFAGLPNVTTNITKTNIRVFKFNHINCPDGTSTMLRTVHLVHLKNTSLEELHVTGNRIEMFEYGLLSDLPKTIKNMSVSENRFGIGKYLLEINQLSELVYVNASFRMPPLEFVNSIMQTCSENQDSCFEGKENYLPATEKNISPNYTITVYIPPKLETIDLTGSKMFATLNPPWNFKVGRNNLTKVLLQGNWVTSWHTLSIGGYINLMYLDISKNFCSYIATKVMRNILKSLLFLNMSNNDFGDMLSSDTFGKFFEKGIQIRNLDLSYNRIHSLPQNIFKNLKRLEYLNISSNRLTSWNVNTRHMEYMKSLDLSNNSISSFSTSAMGDLEFLTSSTNVSIDLSGNGISCSCDNLKFLHWMNKRKSHFKNSDKYKCSEKGRFRVFVFMPTLTETCRSYIPLYVIVSVLVSLTSSIAISFAMYKNRWKLRYLRYNFIQRFFMGRNNEQWDGYNRIYEYDAYISYVGKDLEFVCQHLIPNLENNTDIKLLIRHRTFLPGPAKIYQILEAIQKSKRTICVVSKNYSKSGWRDFELNMAVIEGIESRRTHGFVYLIIFPDVCDANVLKLVKNKYYVEYPDDSNGHSEFWHNLRDVIRSDYTDQ